MAGEVNTSAAISESTASSTLTNVDNTIQGSGEIGNNGLSLNNQSVIDANQSGTLLIDGPAVTNTGTLEATGGGTLEIQSSAVTNSSGTISTGDSSSSVILGSGATISGGDLTSASGAAIHGVGNPSLTGVTIGSGSTFSVDTAQSTTLTGDLINNGTVLIGNSVSSGSLIVGAPTVTLSGSGSVVLNNADSQINANPSSGSDTLVNDGSTIQGQGTIQDLNFINQGTVNANVSGGTLDINQVPTTNTGTLEATGGGTLEISNSAVSNTNGTISTDGSSSVILSNSGIGGGNLTSTGTPTAPAPRDSWTRRLPQWRHHHVRIDLLGRPRPVQLPHRRPNQQRDGPDRKQQPGRLSFVNASTVNLSGGGTVILNNASSSYLRGSASTDTLVNTDNTIQGQGSIDGLNFVNQATVNANAAGGTLTIQAPNSQTPITNTGTLEATGGGTLYFLNSTVTNTNATISTDGSSSSVILNSSGIIGGNLTSTNGAVIQASQTPPSAASPSRPDRLSRSNPAELLPHRRPD